MRWSGAGAGLVVIAIVFIIVAMGVVVLFQLQPTVDRPPEPCTPRTPILQGPEITLAQFTFQGNDSALLAVEAGSRELTLHAAVITWREGLTWRWDGRRTTGPGETETLRIGGSPLRSESCTVGDITVIYTIPGQGRVNATAREMVQRVP